jgi:hypothetical protein
MKNWDEFANGVTAPRKKVVDSQDNESPRPDYGDEWANKAFNIKGPNIDKIRDNTHR